MASNLALALAEIGRPVLLIDGDLRKGRLHEIFQVSNAWGFSDLLAGREAAPRQREVLFRDMLPSACICCLPGQRAFEHRQLCSIHHGPWSF